MNDSMKNNLYIVKTHHHWHFKIQKHAPSQNYPKERMCSGVLRMSRMCSCRNCERRIIIRLRE